MKDCAYISRLPELPISKHLPELLDACETGSTVILTAPPGSGKTTLAPPALLDAEWLGQRNIIVLEPRRLAARAAARRVADLLGEPPGKTVGYHVRMERRLGPDARIAFLTEGLLNQRILSDPALESTGIVLFDEFHERSLQADLALALCRDIQEGLRPDLKLLIMSATLDPEPLTGIFPGARVLSVDAPSFPVKTTWLNKPDNRPCWRMAAEAVWRALNDYAGDLLVFLPGEPEIRRTQAELRERLPPHVHLRPLYGALSRRDQDAAILPSPPGQRKVVLASAIAESSLTLDGIEVVIDTGWMRTNEYSPHWGMNRLSTRRITRDRADQRRGRAGRTAPGFCLRLWDPSAERTLQPTSEPEILRADLSSAALQLADWGVNHPDRIVWVTPPPSETWNQARSLLHSLSALDDSGRITSHGRRMVRLGAHPRLAHMMVAAAEEGYGEQACRMAALIGELAATRLAHRETDIDFIAAETRNGSLKAAPDIIRRVKKLAEGWIRQLRISGPTHPVSSGVLLCAAYPDRLGRAVDGTRGRYRMRSGRTATLDPADPLCSADWLIAPEIQETAGGIRIRLAAPLADDEVKTHFVHLLHETDRVFWDDRRDAVHAVRDLCLDRIRISCVDLPSPPADAVLRVFLNTIRQRGLAALPWSRQSDQIRQRALFVACLEIESDWPRLDDAFLAERLDAWLGPYLAGKRRWNQIKKRDVETALTGMFTPRQRFRLDRLAPPQLRAPSGANLRLHYEAGSAPILAVRIQDAFGWPDTPRIADGKIPVLLHLLSPANRPVQITGDLANFWLHGYPNARKELRGRYPKHNWPEVAPGAGEGTTGPP